MREADVFIERLLLGLIAVIALAVVVLGAVAGSYISAGSGAVLLLYVVASIASKYVESLLNEGVA